jgi:hypothetical protein
MVAKTGLGDGEDEGRERDETGGEQRKRRIKLSVYRPK